MLLPPQSRAPGTRSTLPPLHGSADALALAELARESRPLLVITESAQDAERLRGEISFFDPALKVLLLPDWETLPYDSFSPHQDLVSERLATLYQISHNAFDIAVVPVTTALYRMPPTSYVAGHTFFLKQGEKLSGEALRSQLTLAGYGHVTQVVSPGEYSFRGGVIDLFPMGSALPYRIDLFDDEIDSIRAFDVDSQRSIYKVNDVRLLPAREFPTDDDGRTTFRRRFREKFEGDPSKSRMYKDVSQGFTPSGIEYYLPLFFEETATLPQYLPGGTLVCLHHGVTEGVQRFWQDTQSRYNLLRGDPDRPLLPPAELFLREDEFFAGIKPFARVDIPPQAAIAEPSAAPTEPPPAVAVDRRADNPLTALAGFCRTYPGRVLLIAESLGRRETMLMLLNEYQLQPRTVEDWAGFRNVDDRLTLGVGPLHDGFVDKSDRIAIITENELYPSQVRTTRATRERRASAEN
ncbi:MAG TPA: transcription-repair coupling factor, partial [Burkholderiales bacterium]|nr:transcription-repair coupling factor [Burkholderiales bacterium]